MEFGTDERLDRELDRGAVRGIECTTENDHAVRVFPDRERAPRSQLVFARLDAVGVEMRGELLDERREPIDSDDRGTIDQQLLGRLELVALDARRDAVEKSPDHLSRGDAQQAGVERRGHVRVSRRQRRSTERRSRSRGLADRDESGGICLTTSGRLSDEAFGRGVPLPPGEIVARIGSA